MKKFLDKLFGKRNSASMSKFMPIGETDTPLKLPLWVNVLGPEHSPAIYEGTFWFIEPMGEYVYYLAGNFDKSDNGFLAFGSASTEARVEVTYELDTISVHKIDDWRHQGWAEQNTQYGTELSHITVGEVFAQLPEDGNADGIINVMPMNLKYQLLSSSGMVRFEFFKPMQGLKEIRMIFQALHQIPEHPERLLTILVRCNDHSQNIGDLIEVFNDLITRFESLPYAELEGATRM